MHCGKSDTLCPKDFPQILATKDQKDQDHQNLRVSTVKSAACPPAWACRMSTCSSTTASMLASGRHCAKPSNSEHLPLLSEKHGPSCLQLQHATKRGNHCTGHLNRLQPGNQLASVLCRSELQVPSRRQKNRAHISQVKWHDQHLKHCKACFVR